MKVILTHNNADFDAVASLLAMHKLEPAATPILPRRVISNVEQFLLLYARQWNFIRAEDLTRHTRVEMAYVVDTQKFSMVRGMKPDTPVHIIDHHRPEDDLPAHYTAEIDSIGSTTTLLTERIIKRGIGVNKLEATLFMLGIYSDTGSLAYKATTPRDVRAAAWQLEQGADLDIVREFLRHTLSPDQSYLLQRLQSTAMSLKIHDQTILIAATVLEEQIREAALVASELMGIFHPDALFILLAIEDDVQIIARASRDGIPLADLMQIFGGNGHPRAAAARVSETSLDDVTQTLIDTLPDFITPAVQVDQLMSRGNIQTLDASASIGKAQSKMLESGHEGYPVIANEQLVGLVTRREVDRAMLHHLQNNPISEIMDANAHTISPQDSIETLKNRILDTGWGQMPVVDDHGKLIGIVTRTDLIKHWGVPADDPARDSEVQNMMQARFSPAVWRLLEAVSQTASAQNEGLFLVGGIVRDLLLERPNIDIDLVVEGDAIRLARALKAAFGGKIHTHQQFGTAKWILTPEIATALDFDWENDDFPDVIDLSTARAEFYEAPTALPTVRRGSIKLDLHRRDFTINAMAIRLSPLPMGHLLDFYNGERDLRTGIVRVLHSLSFVDDPTRMIRAVRFEQRFGFHIEQRTADKIQAGLEFLPRLSGDRIRNEISLIMQEADPAKAIYRLDEFGILAAIHPSLQLSEQTQAHFSTFASTIANPPWQTTLNADDALTIGLGLLLFNASAKTIDEICKRLLMSGSYCKTLHNIHRAYQNRSGVETLAPSQVVDQFERLGNLAWLANWILWDADQRATLKNLATTWQYVQSTLNGNDLRKLGLKPGPTMGKLLKELRDGWLDGQFETQQDEEAHARRRIQALQ